MSRPLFAQVNLAALRANLAQVRTRAPQTQVLAVVKAALRSVYGEEVVATQVSGYYLALEMTRVYGGMMIAIPPEQWQVFGKLDGKGMAGLLRDLAGRIKLAKYRKQTRKPKKPAPKRIHDPQQPHVAISELLAQRKKR